MDFICALPHMHLTRASRMCTSHVHLICAPHCTAHVHLACAPHTAPRMCTSPVHFACAPRMCTSHVHFHICTAHVHLACAPHTAPHMCTSRVHLTCAQNMCICIYFDTAIDFVLHLFCYFEYICFVYLHIWLIVRIKLYRGLN